MIGRHLATAVVRASPTIASPQEVLGADHPLARALDRVGVLRRQAGVTALAAVASAVGLLADVDWAPPALTAAIVVELVLALGLAMAVSEARERARDLVIAGDEVDVPVVARQRRRFLSRRQHLVLASSLEDLVRCAERADRDMGGLLPLHDPLLIRRVGPELLALASELRSAAVEVRGVARIERLLTSGSSPLYGKQIEELRAELVRIHADTAVGRLPGHGGTEQSSDYE